MELRPTGATALMQGNDMVVDEAAEVKGQDPSVDKCGAPPPRRSCAYSWALYLGYALLVILASGVAMSLFGAPLLNMQGGPSAKVLRILRLLRAVHLSGPFIVVILTILLLKLRREERLPKGCERCCSCGCAFLPISLGLLTVVGLIHEGFFFSKLARGEGDVDAVMPAFCANVFFLIWIGVLSLAWLCGLRRRRQGLCG
mmetsp:Transcript_12890/g.26145  ORF Transcript_12890/g.26145 Transcript_12890/m.26145 type:complete len:200 (-) Transcript_12890:83-682(-)